MPFCISHITVIYKKLKTVLEIFVAIWVILRGIRISNLFMELPNAMKIFTS